MNTQYMLLAENITYKNNKLSCINVIDQFFVMKLPAEAYFDLVAICGPDWEPGEYELSIKVQADEGELFELGNTKINIPNKDFVYNALAPDMKVRIDEGTKYIRFYVYRNNELILQRNYKVASLLVQQEIAEHHHSETSAA
jgi:hypothetical protein